MKTQTHKFDIDLRWSLWSRHPEEFDRYPEALQAMRNAFEGKRGVIIHTAPRKEIRYGTVTIAEKSAHVDFFFEWDEPCAQLWRIEEIATDLTDAECKMASDQIAMWFAEMTWGAEEEVIGETFEELLAAIDQVQSDLLSNEDAQSKAFEVFIKTLGEEVKNRRDPNYKPKDLIFPDWESDWDLSSSLPNTQQ